MNSSDDKQELAKLADAIDGALDAGCDIGMFGRYKIPMTSREEWRRAAAVLRSAPSAEQRSGPYSLYDGELKLYTIMDPRGNYLTAEEVLIVMNRHCEPSPAGDAVAWLVTDPRGRTSVQEAEPNLTTQGWSKQPLYAFSHALRSESPLAWLVFVEDHPEGWDYMVFANEDDAERQAANEATNHPDGKQPEVVPLYRGSAFTKSATLSTEDAVQRILRRIEVARDDFDPGSDKWLGCQRALMDARAEAGLMRRTESRIKEGDGA